MAAKVAGLIRDSKLGAEPGSRRRPDPRATPMLWPEERRKDLIKVVRGEAAAPRLYPQRAAMPTTKHQKLPKLRVLSDARGVSFEVSWFKITDWQLGYRFLETPDCQRRRFDGNLILHLSGAVQTAFECRNRERQTWKSGTAVCFWTHRHSQVYRRGLWTATAAGRKKRFFPRILGHKNAVWRIGNYGEALRQTGAISDRVLVFQPKTGAAPRTKFRSWWGCFYRLCKNRHAVCTKTICAWKYWQPRTLQLTDSARHRRSGGVDGKQYLPDPEHCRRLLRPLGYFAVAVNETLIAGERIRDYRRHAGETLDAGRCTVIRICLSAIYGETRIVPPGRWRMQNCISPTSWGLISTKPKALDAAAASFQNYGTAARRTSATAHRTAKELNYAETTGNNRYVAAVMMLSMLFYAPMVRSVVFCGLIAYWLPCGNMPVWAALCKIKPNPLPRRNLGFFGVVVYAERAGCCLIWFECVVLAFWLAIAAFMVEI